MRKTTRLATFVIIMLFADNTPLKFGLDTFLPELDIPKSFRTKAITSCVGLIFLFAGVRSSLRILTFSTWQPVSKELDILPMGLLVLLCFFTLLVVVRTPAAFAKGNAAASAFIFEGIPMLITFQRATAGVSALSLLTIAFTVFA